jgi:hypothetical protein
MTYARIKRASLFHVHTYLPIALLLVGCTHRQTLVSDGQISVQLDNRWRLQPDQKSPLYLERREGLWGSSPDLLAFHSHPACMTPAFMAKSQTAFTEGLSKRGATIHSFALATEAGPSTCVVAIHHNPDPPLSTEFLSCYLPEANVLYAGDPAFEPEAIKMIQSLHSDRPCTTQR